jgi:hypothetical protein
MEGLLELLQQCAIFAPKGFISKLQIVQPCFGDGGANADIIKF